MTMTDSETQTTVPGDTIMSDLSKDQLEEILRSGINDIGNGYNNLEDRVYNTEQSIKNIKPRLSTLETQIQPYAEYKQQAQNAVKQLSDLKGRIDSVKAGTAADSTNLESLSEKVKKFEADHQKMSAALKEIKKHNKQVDEGAENMNKRFKYLDDQSRKTEGINSDVSELKATVQALLKRVDKLESGDNGKAAQEAAGSQPQVQSQSAQDIARALIQRLNQGEVLDDATKALLGFATATKPSEHLATPSTDMGSTKDTVEKSTPPTAMKPPNQQKRRRADFTIIQAEETETSKRSSRKRRSEPDEAEASEPPKKRSRKEKGNEPDQTEAEDDQDDEPAAKRPRGRPRKITTGGPGRPRIERASRSRTRQAVQQAEESDDDDEEDEETDEPFTPRRTGRTAKPSKRHEDYLTWPEVKARRATPKKSQQA